MPENNSDWATTKVDRSLKMLGNANTSSQGHKPHTDFVLWSHHSQRSPLQPQSPPSHQPVKDPPSLTIRMLFTLWCSQTSTYCLTFSTSNLTVDAGRTGAAKRMTSSADSSRQKTVVLHLFIYFIFYEKYLSPVPMSAINQRDLVDGSLWLAVGQFGRLTVGQSSKLTNRQTGRRE